MKTSPVQNQGTPIETQSTPADQGKNQRASKQTSSIRSAEKATDSNATSVAPSLQRQTDVTYRKDSDGRVYYAVSDAKSGEEILEVPPKALRDVGQGIEEYLKEEQSKASAHITVKG